MAPSPAMNPRVQIHPQQQMIPGNKPKGRQRTPRCKPRVAVRDMGHRAGAACGGVDRRQNRSAATFSTVSLLFFLGELWAYHRGVRCRLWLLRGSCCCG